MYKVFVNELPLILTNKLSETANGEYFPLNESSIQQAIKALKKKKLSEAYIYHPNHEEILKKFTKKIPLTVAAGGVVTNTKGKVLFIYRNDKWDLPKGKLEKGGIYRGLCRSRGDGRNRRKRPSDREFFKDHLSYL